MTVKEYLSQAFTIDRILRMRQTQIEELEAKRFFIGTTLDGVAVKTGHRKDRIGNLSAKLLDMIDDYIQDTERLLSLKAEIKGLIDKLDNQTHRLILTERYINLKRWEDVAADNNYSWQHVHKLHNQALRSVEIVISESE